MKAAITIETEKKVDLYLDSFDVIKLSHKANLSWLHDIRNLLMWFIQLASKKDKNLMKFTNFCEKKSNYQWLFEFEDMELVMIYVFYGEIDFWYAKAAGFCSVLFTFLLKFRQLSNLIRQNLSITFWADSLNPQNRLLICIHHNHC
jgi:hypothetical protein